MKTSTSNAAVILNMENDVFIDPKDDITLNFSAPKTEIRPFIELIDEEQVSISLHKNRMLINNQLKIHFDDPSVISTLESDGPLNNIEYFIDIDMDDEFFNKFKKIKKIGNRFGKIYITVSKNELYIETTDKTNAFSNGMNFKICDIENEDLSLCFDYVPFSNMMSVIDFGFKAKLASVDDGGLIYMKKEDGSENYFLMSFTE